MTLELAVDHIDYSRFMLREIDGQTINDLKESIKNYGVLQPILVFLNEKNRHEVICGNHRLCAAKGVGLRTIPVVICPVPTANEALILSLTENIQRYEMNPLREGEIFSLLLQDYTVDVLVEKLGKSRNYVDGRIKLFKNLHSDLKNKIGKTLTLTNALALSRLPQSQQLEIHQQIERNSNIPNPQNPVYNPFGGASVITGTIPYCTCEKCGAKHLKGVSIKF